MTCSSRPTTASARAKGGAGIDLYDISAGVGGGNIYTYDMSAGGGVALGGGPNFFTFIDEFENLNTILSSGGAIVTGNAKANRITGSNAADTIDGGDGNDTLLGGDGNDVLDGGTGADSVNAGAGNDIVLAREGSDTVFGSLGDDLINGGAGGDFLNGGAGQDTLSYSGDTADLDVRLFSNTASGGWAQNDTISNFEHLTLGAGNDFGQGTFGDNRIFGAAGNDTLVGLGGDDTVNGGGGDDMIFGDAGADDLTGSIGNDTLNYSPDSAGVTVQLWNNFVTGGIATGDTIGGFENVIGGTGDDVLQGTIAANMLDGNAGNDTINGLGGNDTLLGGGGNDQILAGSGTDSLDGGAGFDMLSYFSDTSGINVSLFFSTASGGNATGDTISNFENVTGGIGDDTLQGTATGNVLFGYNGNDTMNGLGGNDTLRGGYGEDYLLGGGGNDRLLGQIGADTLVGGAGDDTLTGGTAGDVFIFSGAFGNDEITDFGFADVARVLGTGAPYDSFGDYDINNDGLINAVDAGLTTKITAGPGGDLTLDFAAGGARSILFNDVGSLNAGDLLFV